MKRIISLFCLFTSTLIAEMPEPYASIKDLPFDDHGWFENADQLNAVITNLQPTTIIEIGSWLGRSTRYIAGLLPENGKLYAVDTWLGSSSENQHMTDKRLTYLYQLFLSNVKHAGLTNKIVPVRMDSIEASNALNVKADLIYIDGAHDTASVKADILAWLKHLSPDGVMCGDDWKWATVREAVIHCSLVLNKKIYGEGNFWMYCD